jgi:ankyrin repeat protein
MPLCEPTAVEDNDNNIKWIREIDLVDLAIERNAADDKEYRIVYNNKWAIAHANSLNAIQHDYNQISTKLEVELKTLEDTKDKMNSNKVVFNRDSYLYCFFQNQYLAAKSLEIHDMLRLNNRWSEAEQFIEKNPECLSIIDEKGQVPLHIIAGAGQSDLVKFVLTLVDRNNSKKGEKKLDPEVNTRDNNNWTPLHCAAFGQHFKSIEVLVRDGNSHVCCLTDKNYTAMHFLARWPFKDEEENKFNEVIKLLMDRGSDINAQAFKGEAPIHEACLHAPLKTVKALLALGADLHLKTLSGDNVLHFAVRAKNFDLAEFLVEKGVDLTAEGEEGTPLELANQLNDTHIVNMLKLYRKAKKATYIPSPSTSPTMSPVRHSLMSSAMDKSTFGTKFTIHDAVTKNQSDRVVFFIQDDESLLNARNDVKWTPALLAAAYGYFDLLKILISRPTIEVNCVTPDGCGILHYCFRNFINQQKEKDTLNDIVSMLMEKRLDINLKNNYGQTALHEASQRGNLAAVDILIKHRAEINATTKNGETPLHYAARGGHLEVIKLLLANKADKHKRGKRGTALDVASNADVVRVIKMYRMPHGSHGSGDMKNDSSDAIRHRPRTDSNSSSTSLDSRRPAAYNDSESGEEDSASFNNENVNNNEAKMTLISPTAESRIKQRHIQHFHLNGNDQLVEVIKILFEGEETKKLTVDAEGDLCIWQHFLTFLSTDSKIHLKISLFDVTNFKYQKVFLQFNKVIVTAGKQKFVFAREEELEGTISVLKHLHASRDITVPLMVLGEPIQHMLGALKYPKENKKFRKTFNLPEIEAIVAFFSCKFGDKTLSPKGKLYASRFHIGFDNGSGLAKLISFENIKSIKEASKKSIVIELPNESFIFSSFNNRSAVFKLLEKLWNDVYKVRFGFGGQNA